jgi:hypothetical protein
VTAFRSIGRGFAVATVAALVLVLLGLVVSDVLVLVGAILAGTFFILGIVFLAVQAKVVGNPEEHARILREGRPVVATLVAVGSTSGRVGGNPLMKLDLAVDGRTVRVGALVPIQHAHRLQVGGELPVRVDGDDIVVDWDRP